MADDVDDDAIPAPVPEPDPEPEPAPGAAPTPTWSMSAPHVRRALAFIQARSRSPRGMTAEELVQWDFRNGRRLFNWDDASAAAEWRIQQARCFLNSFRNMFDRMRVRLVTNIPADPETGRPRAYHHVEKIMANADLRDAVVADLTKRMASLASELRMWALTPVEQQTILARLQEALQ